MKTWSCASCAFLPISLRRFPSVAKAGHHFSPPCEGGAGGVVPARPVTGASHALFLSVRSHHSREPRRIGLDLQGSRITPPTPPSQGGERDRCPLAKGEGIAPSRRHSIARNKNSRLETVPPAQSTPTFRQPSFHHLFESWIVLEHSDGLAPGLSVCRVLRLGDEEDRHALFEDREFSQVLVANEHIGMTSTGIGLTQRVRDRRALCELDDLRPDAGFDERDGNRLSIDLLDAQLNLSKPNPRGPVQPHRLYPIRGVSRRSIPRESFDTLAAPVHRPFWPPPARTGEWRAPSATSTDQRSSGRGINPSHPVPENERGHRGTAILVLHVQRHQDRGVTRKEDVHVAAKPEVLRPLADIEAEFGLALAGVAAVNLDDPVLDGKSRERALQGAVAKRGQVHPALGELRGTDRPFRLGTAGRLPVDRLGVGTGRLKLRGHTSLVPYLDQKHRPAVLHQPGSCRTLGRLHPAFGVDVDSDQAMSIHDSLERWHARLLRVRPA